tara:strand:+ start:809 stop:1081 length:273 start_codon:yes stop_codon:yes gene_type:complete
MTYLSPNKFFDVGVFAETLSNIDVFSSNIYLTQMLASAVEQYSEIQIEYEEAVAQNDEALQQQKEMELKICEGNFAMASAMFNLWEKDYS